MSRPPSIVSVSVLAALTHGTAFAVPDAGAGDPDGLFQHVGTFDVTLNGNEVAEIVAATANGRRLVYTDASTGSIGFVDIADPANPIGEGMLDMGGSPTSVAILDDWALVAVDTSVDFVTPTGDLVVVDLLSQTETFRMPLGGQPDSIKISQDHTMAAVILENQRDEDLDDGLLPQLPAGQLAIVDILGDPASWTLRTVDLTGLADTAPDDPEPENVDINRRNEAIVSLQENNHFAIVDLLSGTVLADFPAGEVELNHVDTVEDELGPQERGLVQLTDTITRRREPDSVAWLGDNRFVSANEGDYEDENGVEGGSRSFTVFDTTGAVSWESAELFEHEAVRVGHYPEDRSENKGAEPESIARGRFGDRMLLFVGSERGNVVEVYDTTSGVPTLLQVLPSGIGPEGLLPINERSLLAVANETAEVGYPSLVTLYRAEEAPAAYPQIQSADDADGVPVPWLALSGLAGDLTDPSTLYTVSDSWLALGFIYTVDVASTPATVLDRTEVTGLSFEPDVEGIAVAPEGGYWLASEGRIDARPNAIVHVGTDGVALFEAELPDTLTAGMTDSGFEGVAATGTSTTDFVYVVLQREWADDPLGQVKIGRYDVVAGTWGFVGYPLDAVESPNGGWVGLSEITLLPDGTFAIIERDNQVGVNARVKRIYGVDLSTVTFRPHGDVLDVVGKTLITDLLDELAANSVWTAEKLEGFGVAADGQVYAVTDNDGLDEVIGQTLFLRLGDVSTLAP
jgi:hypothetical protein